MTKISILRKVVIGTILAVVSLALIGTMIFLRGSELTSFTNIRGLNGISVFTSYNNLLTRMRSEPLTREVITHENRSETYVLHYDGVRFYVRNGRVSRIVMTGEQFRLGGRNRIGVGSTRAQVETTVTRWQRGNAFTADCSCSRFRSWNLDNGNIALEQYNIEILIVFGEDDTVIEMRSPS
jgi:hypothetical protein